LVFGKGDTKPILVNGDIRLGDSPSSLLFNVIMDKITDEVKNDIE